MGGLGSGWVDGEIGWGEGVNGRWFAGWIRGEVGK